MSSIEDGISYVEARINFLFKLSLGLCFLFLVLKFEIRSFFGPDGRNTLTHRDMLKIYGSVVQEVKDEMKRQGREDEFVGSRVFYHSHLFFTPHWLTIISLQRSSIPQSR